MATKTGANADQASNGHEGGSGLLADEFRPPEERTPEQLLREFFSTDQPEVPQSQLDEYMLAWTVDEIELRQELLETWNSEPPSTPERLILRRSEVDRLKHEIATLRLSLRRPDGSVVSVDPDPMPAAQWATTAGGLAAGSACEAGRVGALRSMRENVLTAPIRKAQLGCPNPWQVSQVWPRLCELARSPGAYPLNGVDEDGVAYFDDKDEVQHLTKEQLRYRLRWAKSVSAQDGKVDPGGAGH